MPSAKAGADEESTLIATETISSSRLDKRLVGKCLQRVSVNDKEEEGSEVSEKKNCGF